MELGGSAIVVTRPIIAAADLRNEALLAAKAVLRRALTARRETELQVEQMRALVARLEAERKATA